MKYSVYTWYALEMGSWQFIGSANSIEECFELFDARSTTYKIVDDAGAIVKRGDNTIYRYGMSHPNWR